MRYRPPATGQELPHPRLTVLACRVTDGVRAVVRVDFSGVDVFSLVDADSDEANTFTTYMGYWVCLADHLQHRYGDDCTPLLLEELRSRPSFRGLPGKGIPTNPEGVRALLLNGWTSELRLNLIDLDDRKRLTLANHGAPIDAYYATSRHATAWLCARDGCAPTTHRALLNAIAAQVTGSRLYPAPWNLCCSALTPEAVYRGFNVVRVTAATWQCPWTAMLAQPCSCAPRASVAWISG